MGNHAEEKAENGEAERKNRSTEEATVRRRQEAGKERTVRLSSWKESESGTENAGIEGDARNQKRRQAPEERLWERIREGRKETYSEAEYRNRERMHGKPGRRERGKPKERK